MIVTEAENRPKEEPAGEEQGGKVIAMGVVWVNVQIEAVETKLEVCVWEGLRVLAQEEVGEEEESEGEKQEEESRT